MVSVPRNIVEYFLLGKTRPDAIERYTQESGIVSDVWLAFARDIREPVRVLIAPSDGISAIELGHTLYKCIRAYRQNAHSDSYSKARRNSGVSPLENFVAVTLYFDELLRVVLPLTPWWTQRGLSHLSTKMEAAGNNVRDLLEEAIKAKLGHEDERLRRLTPAARPATEMIDAASGRRIPDWNIVQAASLAALIGVFVAAENGLISFPAFAEGSRKSPADETAFKDWVWDNAETIAKTATQELSRPLNEAVLNARAGPLDNLDQIAADEPPNLIHRVFLNREAVLAHREAISTVKADAAKRLFEVSCRTITWAIIDSGIAGKHPAFADHFEASRKGVSADQVRPRVRATLDFTVIEAIRNFDLTEHPEGSAEREQSIRNVVRELETLPGRETKPLPTAMATDNLRRIAGQLEARLMPDWSLIEPLILLEPDDGGRLFSGHGTHVAGILAADWREIDPRTSAEKEILRGVCPDINLYDLRVIDPNDHKSTEFAILAALEYIQFVNTRSIGRDLIVHGVNISLSIPHDVRNYACGATPICVSCDRLAGTGVVVVAAAGNRGWNEQEIGFGNFVFCSITDPGNARDVITVGSTHRLKPHTYGVSFFSSRGPTGDGRIKPDLVAPGERINGPLPGAGNDELDGTSMAAPFVSGAAAMLMARNRELIGDSARIKDILCRSATDLGREKYFQGHGLLDILRALQSI